MWLIWSASELTLVKLEQDLDNIDGLFPIEMIELIDVAMLFVKALVTPDTQQTIDQRRLLHEPFVLLVGLAQTIEYEHAQELNRIEFGHELGRIRSSLGLSLCQRVVVEHLH